MNLSGTYRASMHTPIGDRPFILKLEVDESGRLTGTYTDDCKDAGHHDHGTSEILWGKVVDRPSELNQISSVNPLREDGANTGTYVFFNLIPHDCDLTFFGVVQESGEFYGVNFHKGHSSLFEGKKDV